MQLSQNDSINQLQHVRHSIRAHHLANESEYVLNLVQHLGLSTQDKQAIFQLAVELVKEVRDETKPGLLDQFLMEYSLSTTEGLSLMCLAEALPRVPDKLTMDKLIQDKIVPHHWSRYLWKSPSPFVNIATLGFMVTAYLTRTPQNSFTGKLQALSQFVSKPLIRAATQFAMRQLGQQFLLGVSIEDALEKSQAELSKGNSYSYDMLGEAAYTQKDANTYFQCYWDAISALHAQELVDNVHDNPGISVKLSALHPRYEFNQYDWVMRDLVPRLRDLAKHAMAANLGFTIDAEEANRLDMSLDVISAVLKDPAFGNWEGFGIAVQAYDKRACSVIDWLYALAQSLNRKIALRLVKGAYWDSEIKLAQHLGLIDFPVFTRKVSTDVNYIACCQKLLQMSDHIYPQFATHNAHTVAAVLRLARHDSYFEFQRLHGMGQALHNMVKHDYDTRCRIYAPVGPHKELLAYLVRRLLENGANSSFVNQIFDKHIPEKRVAEDPVLKLSNMKSIPNVAIASPRSLYSPVRQNARGWDLEDPTQAQTLLNECTAFQNDYFDYSLNQLNGPKREIYNPAYRNDKVGCITEATIEDASVAFRKAAEAQIYWQRLSISERANILNLAADLYEAHAYELMVLICREAGKTFHDAVDEVREAIDFLRYYAIEAYHIDGEARGVFVCISPWNFPLAIFTGQIAAALITGNAVLAKPAEQTPLVASLAVQLLYKAGVHQDILSLLPGDGETIGAFLTSSPRAAGLCFTGSTETAQVINMALGKAAPMSPLIAETGGLNAMIVDSTALPEQVVRDVLASAFQSAGQRCSSLRILYVQEDIKDRILEMLFGAMDTLQIADPWDLSCDIGPVIDQDAYNKLNAYSLAMERGGRVLKKLPVPDNQNGFYIPPTAFAVRGIEELEQEIFGPFLHIASFKAHDLDHITEAINAKGYGLTFGLHSRIDARVKPFMEQLAVGNIYINRNQIGAVVGVQPFGGQGMSGTGPKAGGPLYLRRFVQKEMMKPPPYSRDSTSVDLVQLQQTIDALSLSEWPSNKKKLSVLDKAFGGSKLAHKALAAITSLPFAGQQLPGPTGEYNHLSLTAKGIFLCLGPSLEFALAQSIQSLAYGGGALIITHDTVSEALMSKLNAADIPLVILEGFLFSEYVESLTGFAGIAYSGDDQNYLSALRQTLAKRPGPLLPVVHDIIAPEAYVNEKTLCINTTAAGGNATLLSLSE